MDNLPEFAGFDSEHLLAELEHAEYFGENLFELSVEMAGRELLGERPA